MKTILIIILLVFIFSTTGYASDWSKTDKVLMGSLIILNTLDAMQTLEIFKSPYYYELNPVIDYLVKQQNTGMIPLYFMGITFSEYLIADYLQPKNRKIFLGVLNAIQIIAIGNNYGLGIRFDF